MTDSTTGKAGQGAMVVLLTLASGQFLMTLDSSVMNVSIATVAKDVGTTETGIQGAITASTLVSSQYGMISTVAPLQHGVQSARIRGGGRR